MNVNKQIKIQKLQNRNRMVGKSFAVLEKDQRRRIPWLGGHWFQKGMGKEREDFIEKWKKETERLQRKNPLLKII